MERRIGRPATPLCYKAPVTQFINCHGIKIFSIAILLTSFTDEFGISVMIYLTFKQLIRLDVQENYRLKALTCLLVFHHTEMFLYERVKVYLLLVLLS
jgi:hypothetical protein